MKKLILGLAMIAIAATTTFVACKKDKVKVANTNKSSNTALSNARVTTGLITAAEMDKILALSSDSLFQALVRIRVAEHNNAILNGSALRTLLSTEMTAAKVPVYASLLGYPTTEEFVQTTNLCKQLEAELEETHQLSSMRMELVAEAVALTSPDVSDPPPAAAAKPAYCGTIYKNTIVQIAAESIIMHTGCAFLDAALVGAICHAAVVTWQISSNNIALANYDACH